MDFGKISPNVIIMKVIIPTMIAMLIFSKYFFAKIVAREAAKMFTRLFPISIVIKTFIGFLNHNFNDLFDFEIKCSKAVGEREVKAVSDAEKKAEKIRKINNNTTSIPIFYVYYILKNFARRNSYTG